MRKAINGFRQLLDQTCASWSDAGFHSTDGDEDREKCDRAAQLAKNRLEGIIIRLIIAAKVVERNGSTAALFNAVNVLEVCSEMEGRRFVSGHRTKLRRKEKITFPAPPGESLDAGMLTIKEE